MVSACGLIQVSAFQQPLDMAEAMATLANETVGGRVASATLYSEAPGPRGQEPCFFLGVGIRAVLQLALLVQVPRL